MRDVARVIAERGATTTLDDVSATTGTSKSRLCECFGDDRGLVKAVVEYQCATVVDWHAKLLEAVDSWEDLERWTEQIVEHATWTGCPIGTLAAVLSDADEALRTRLRGAFAAWKDAIRGALGQLQERGLIATGADLDALATMTLSAVQGGLLLAKLTRDADQLRTALDGALVELRSHAPTDPRMVSS